MSYYKQGGGLFGSSKEDIAHLKGEIQLTSDSVVKVSSIDDKVNCFELVTPTKTMFAQASSTPEMHEWIAAIQSHIDDIKNSTITSSRRRVEPSNEFESASTIDDVKALQEMVAKLVKENQQLRENEGELEVTSQPTPQ